MGGDCRNHKIRGHSIHCSLPNKSISSPPRLEHRPDHGRHIPAAAPRLGHQKSLRVLTGCYFWAHDFPSWRRVVCDIEPLDLRGIIARLRDALSDVALAVTVCLFALAVRT